MTFKEYPDRDLLAIDLANALAGELENCLLRHEHASFAVPGGTSPGPVFDVLCAADLDWGRVHVMLTDERWVPQDHARSNARLIQDRLLTDRAARAVFLPFYAPAEDPEAVLAEVTAPLVPELPLSVLLMGMGTDMHVASLFPGAPGIEAALAPDAPILVAQSPPTQPEARVSLSARVLDGALSKHLLITGEEKRAALERAMALPPEEAPINAVLSETTIHWAP
ncbi:6-phosphogluconolactonase [Aestuariivita sp.]|uniref:6-phosphogluconolactonase n=1 Tax=Aestuariivita sp. TaxID=1872407 RepID=UPI00216F1AD1|nr:6-phosphogluconolactonase [Aestuariivita sp.]MCE8009671.1 6-phosphogluconolactonase [Aestuariivita sp.]